MKLLRAAIVLCLGFVLAGCMVETETFLTERSAAGTDARLVGVWTVRGQETETGFLFVREAEDGGFDVLSLDMRDDPETQRQTAKWQTAVAWTAEIDGAGYVNMETGDDKVILAYKVHDDGALEFGYMDPDPFREAIENGVLKGTVTTGFLGPEPRLQDTAENIARFLKEKGGHTLFVFGDDENRKERLILVRHRLGR